MVRVVVTAREVSPDAIKLWRKLKDVKSRPRGKIIQRFPNIKTARAWLAQQSEQRCANVYIQYKPSDLLQ